MDAPTVEVRLEAPAEVPPGVPFEVVARVRAPAGWHVYWGENPGASGLPTRARLFGVVHDAPRWTAPTLHTDSGGIRTYVYEPSGAAVFLARPGTPGTLALKAELSWLACREACVPGSTTVEATVHVVEGARAPKPGRTRLPAPAPASLAADGPLRVCLPAGLGYFPDSTFESLGVVPAHDGTAWVARLPADAPPEAAVVYTRDARTSWYVQLGEIGTHPPCP